MPRGSAPLGRLAVNDVEEERLQLWPEWPFLPEEGVNRYGSEETDRCAEETCSDNGPREREVGLSDGKHDEDGEEEQSKLGAKYHTGQSY